MTLRRAFPRKPATLLSRPATLLSRPASLLRGGPAAFLAFALLALAVGLEPLLVRAFGSRAPGWSHWWCSPASRHSPAHTTGGGGTARSLLAWIETLAPHWPHFLPILLGVAALVYLYRADTRYRSATGTA